EGNPAHERQGRHEGGVGHGGGDAELGKERDRVVEVRPLAAPREVERPADHDAGDEGGEEGEGGGDLESHGRALLDQGRGGHGQMLRPPGVRGLGQGSLPRARIGEGTMLIRRRPGWEIPERQATPEDAFMNRRRFLVTAAAGGLMLAGRGRGLGAEKPPTPPPSALTATRSPKWMLDGMPTDEKMAGRYNNFYEFSEQKDVWRHVEGFRARPWTVEGTGLVAKPRTWDLDQILKLPLEERLYRHRCVEAWYMDVPWIGVPLSVILQASEPLAKARHVRFLSFLNKQQAPGQM